MADALKSWCCTAAVAGSAAGNAGVTSSVRRAYLSSGQDMSRPEDLARLAESAWRSLSAAERAPYDRRVKCAAHACLVSAACRQG